MKMITRYIGLICLSVTLFACETGRNYEMKTPESFAELTREKQSYKSISADGVRLMVYSVRNDPYHGLKLWKAAVSYYLKGNGYLPKTEKDIMAAGDLSGNYAEYVIRYNAENYIYAVTIFVDKKNIFIVETGGIEPYYKKKRGAILKSLNRFRAVE